MSQTQTVTAAPVKGGGSTRIEIDAVAKEFGSLRVFQNVSFEIGQRECVAIVGPSGCGKTTLLRCIDGLVQPTEGEIRINGTPVRKPPKGVAVVFQQFGLFPWKTVFNNVAYGMQMAGASKAAIRERVPKMIELVGLAGFEKAYPYQLSGGMQQRTGLARAPISTPAPLEERRAADSASALRRLSASPCAMRICALTISMPVTSSVTGCSTCTRVFISMK